MKLLHVVPGMHPTMGGVCQAVRSIVYGLENKKISSEVVSLDEPGSPFLLNDRFIVHALGHKPGAWMFSRGLIPWLVENLSRFNAVIVHGMWNYHAYAAYKAMAVYKRLHKHEQLPSFYVMPHGMLDPYFQRASGRRLKAVRNWVYWKMIEQHVINKADGLLFTCEEEQRLAAGPFRPYRPKKQIVTGLGVEYPPPYSMAMKQSFFAKCSSCVKRPYLLFLGRIDEKKGVDVLIHAYNNLVHRRGPAGGSAIRSGEGKPATTEDMLPALVIAGPGQDTPYGKAMQQLVSRLSLQDQICFPGMLTGNAKWGAFYGCDAFVLPSHQENFGIAVVEALACSRPVLITNQVNIWREIKLGSAGLISEDTVEGVFGLLESWLDMDGEEKHAFGKRGRYVYNEYFSTSSASDRFCNALAT